MIRNVNLTLLIGPAVPIPAPRPVLDALQAVEVTTATGSASGFQLTFAVANDSPLHTILLLAANANPGFLRVILVVTVERHARRARRRRDRRDRRSRPGTGPACRPSP